MYLSESLHLYEVADYWRSIIKLNEHQKDRFTKRIITSLFNTLRGKKIAVLGFAFKKNTSDTRESPAITLVSNMIAEGARIGIYDPQVSSEQILRDLQAEEIAPQRVRAAVEICQCPYAACAEADAVVVMTEWDEFSNKVTQHCLGVTTPTTSLLQEDAEAVEELGNVTLREQAQRKPCSPEPPKTLTESCHSGTDAQGEQMPILTKPKAHTSGKVRLDWARVAKGMKKPMFIFDGRNILDSTELEKLGFHVEAIGKAGTALRETPIHI